MEEIEFQTLLVEAIALSGSYRLHDFLIESIQKFGTFDKLEVQQRIRVLEVAVRDMRSVRSLNFWESLDRGVIREGMRSGTRECA